MSVRKYRHGDLPPTIVPMVCLSAARCSGTVSHLQALLAPRLLAPRPRLANGPWSLAPGVPRPALRRRLANSAGPASQKNTIEDPANSRVGG
jgi:hypothetical protein